MTDPFTLRLATPADVPTLAELIPLSVRALSAEHYTPAQIESSIRYVFGLDTELLADGTYFAVETVDGQIVGCGGWSRRRTLFGGNQAKGTALAPTDDLLDPNTDAARVRAFFIHPDWARLGIASRIMQACLAAARAAGFRRLILAATLPGVPLYRAWGFVETRPLPTTLPDGTSIAFVEMSSTIDAPTPV